MLLVGAERRLGIATKLAAVIPDGRDASRVTHPLAHILRARIFAIACARKLLIFANTVVARDTPWTERLVTP